MGWSEIQRYSFRVPPGWEETPVSIADLGGTEIDLRCGARGGGQCAAGVGGGGLGIRYPSSLSSSTPTHCWLPNPDHAHLQVCK